MPGPVPKRSSQRRRTNKPTVPTTKAPAKRPARAAQPADLGWHPAARRWYESLGKSGQSSFYEPSDWATAWLIAESISRELSPQPVVTKDGTVVMVNMPPKAASVVGWLKAATALLATEGDRRRLRLELETGGAPVKEATGVSDLADYRRRLAGPAG